MKNMSYLLLVISFLTPFPARAQKEEIKTEKAPVKLDHHVSIVGLANFYSPRVTNTGPEALSLTSSSNLGVGVGLLGGFTLGGPLDFEYGLLIMRRENTYSGDVIEYKEASNWVALPVGAKFKFTEIFSVVGGPYLGYRVGEVTNAYSVSTTSEVKTPYQERFELGWYGAAVAAIPIIRNIGVHVELRYLKGLTNISMHQNMKINSSDLMCLAGVQANF